MIGTRAAGNGALEIIAATGSAPGCPEVLYKYDGTDPVDTASIERLMFDQRPNSVITYRDPNLLEPVQLEGPSDEPIPRKVELGLSFGTQDWAWVWETCKTFMGITAFGWNGNYLLTALGHDSFLNTRGIRQIAVNPATSDGWLFDTDPFKATLTKTRAFPEPFLDSVLPASVSVELIITLEHTPAP